MRAAVGGDVGVKAAEFLLDDGNAVVDEFRSGADDLVLVFHPLLLVNAYHGVDHVGGALRNDIGIADVEVRRLFVGQCHRQTRLHSDSHII